MSSSFKIKPLGALLYVVHTIEIGERKLKCIPHTYTKYAVNLFFPIFYVFVSRCMTLIIGIIGKGIFSCYVLHNITCTHKLLTCLLNVCAELPPDMQFSSANVISICGYGILFIVSSMANLTVLNILVRRYKKTKSRVNLLLIHLAIADLLVRSQLFISAAASLIDSSSIHRR